MNRGDIVIAAVKGAFSGKPRPMVVVQSNLLNDRHPSVILALITSDVDELGWFRVPLSPTAENGLREESEIMADKLVSLRTTSVQRVIGRVDAESLARLDQILLMVLGLA